MASRADDTDIDGVTLVHEDDGRVTAVDEETGVASYGDTKAEALRMLAEALELHDGVGEPVSDDDLRAFGLDPDATDDRELPDSLQQWSGACFRGVKSRACFGSTGTVSAGAL